MTRLEDQLPIHTGTNGTQTVHTDVLGRLRPKIPVMGNTNPDFAYKVTYLGHYKNISEGTLDSNDVFIMERTPQNLKDLLVVPNPNNGTFKIICNEVFTAFTLTDQMGQIVLQKSELSTETMEMSTTLSGGIYVLTILLENGTQLQTKISIL